MCLVSKKLGITEPLLPITLPYLTIEKAISFFPLILMAAINSLSEQSFVAPYRFIGELALSVDNAITFFTLFFNEASIKFCAPIIFVLMVSIGLYSAVGTCFNAAA